MKMEVKFDVIRNFIAGILFEFKNSAKFTQSLEFLLLLTQISDAFVIWCR